ncbi:hypothetical protein B5M09_009022 [Aphanomyces astaci]|uniref:Rab-GAP TBC domain-containing protein n=1 Tax=Aphanomyces astaci TaxID=112090 RepID=A0A425C3V0_APHAT|nr:hypothetical protein B5M09_009022 [Aphanomyces astaci]
MQRTVAQHAVATSAADGIDAPTDASAAASAPPHPADAATPAKASSGNWIQARLDQLKNSVKKHFAPQLTELKSKLTTSASFSRDRIRTSGEQLQPALSKAKGGVVGLTRRVSHTSAHMQQQVEALLGARLVHDLFVTKKHAVEDDRSQFVMDSKASPTHFALSAVPLSSKAQRLVEEEETSFWLFVALLDQYGLEAMFSPGLSKLHLHCYQFNRFLQLGLPKLHAHFEVEGMSVQMYLVGWFQTLFLYLNALPRHSIDNMWDIFMAEKSWKILFRVALALLSMCEAHLLQQPIDSASRFLNTFATHLPMLEPYVLVPTALRIKVTNRHLADLSLGFDSTQPLP